MRFFRIARTENSVTAILTLISQIILGLSAYLLALIFSPSDIGFYGSIIGYSSILSLIILGSYHLALSQSKTTDDARAILSSLKWRLVTAFILFICLISGISFAYLSGSINGGTWFFITWVFVVAIAICIQQILISYFIFLHLIGEAGKYSLKTSIVQVISQILMGLVKPVYMSLIIGYAFSRLIFPITYFSHRRPRNSALQSSLTGISKDWRKFSRWMTLPVVLNSLTVTAATALISSLYGFKLAGSFFLAFQLLSIPGQLVSNSIGRTFISTTAKMQDDNVFLERYIVKISMLLFGISSIFVVPFFFAETLTITFLGNQWVTTGNIMATLSPWLALNTVSSTLSSFASLRERYYLINTMAVVESSLRIAALVGGLYISLSDTPFYLYAISGSIISMFWILLVLRMSGVKFFRCFSIALFMVCASSGMFILLLR